MSTSGSRPAVPGYPSGPVQRFVFVPDGAEVPAEALAQIENPIRLRATYFPTATGAGTRAERRSGWSESSAGQSDDAGTVRAFDDGAAAAKNDIFGSDGTRAYDKYLHLEPPPSDPAAKTAWLAKDGEINRTLEQKRKELEAIESRR